MEIENTNQQLDTDKQPPQSQQLQTTSPIIQESSKMSIRKDIKKIISDQYESFKSMYNAASEAEDNENAILYLTYICNSHMFSIIRTKKIPTYLKKHAYSIQKKYTSCMDAFNGIKSAYIPKGIKIILLYRFLPFKFHLADISYPQ